MQTVMLSTGANPKNKQDWLPWTASVLTHVIVVGTLLSVHPTADQPLQEPERHEIFTPLIYRPVSLPVAVVHAPVRITRIEPAVQKPKTLVLKHLPPVMPVRPRPASVPVPAPPEPILQAALPDVPVVRSLKAADLPARPAPPPVPSAPVKTGVFGSPGESPNARTPAPRLEVQTGGFGGPGSHAQMSGNGSVAGSAVHMGGFGDSAGNHAGSQSGNGKPAVVADAGFGNAAAQAVPQRRSETATPAETPVEVLWKPKPAYTEEARAKKLEGNVTLEVVFRAVGDVHVVRVVRGLGCGLDESARTAAEQIRFRPGKKDGIPVDRTGLVLITFELS